MNSTITIRVEGQHGSISDLEWRDIPPFAVITGVNGTGKTQLLETIAASYGAWRGRNPYRRGAEEISAHAVVEGDSFAPGEVFHTYDEWLPLGASGASEQQVKDAIRELRSTAYPPHRTDILEALASQLGITMEELLNLPIEQFYENLTPGQLSASISPSWNTNLAFLFLAYRLFEKDAMSRGLSEKEVHRLYGEPPWILLNEILKTSGLPFRVNHPELPRPTSLVYDRQFVLRLHDIERNQGVPFEGLSSGELVIMSTVIWRYSVQQVAKHPRFLLLDEPDAHLHPSLTRRFLDVVRKVFVEERGVRVIMTTHSPSTVALAPEESLFEMRRTPPRIQPASSKGRAVAVLTDGFVAVQEATQTVLLEGKEDPLFYTLIWDLLTERSNISEPGPLEPFPSLVFIHGKGKETVEGLIPQMRARGLQSFHGILDKDLSNVPSEGIYIINRNGMENYLFDPLNVWVLLLSEDQAPDVSGVNIPRSREAYIRNLSEVQLQAIADVVLDKVESWFSDLDGEAKSREEVTFANGKQLRYPKWFLYRDDKEIRKAFCESFGHHLLRPGDPKKLLNSYAALNMVPEDLLDLFKTIQASGSPW